MINVTKMAAITPPMKVPTFTHPLLPKGVWQSGTILRWKIANSLVASHTTQNI